MSEVVQSINKQEVDGMLLMEIVIDLLACFSFAQMSPLELRVKLVYECLRVQLTDAHEHLLEVFAAFKIEYTNGLRQEV